MSNKIIPYYTNKTNFALNSKKRNNQEKIYINTVNIKIKKKTVQIYHIILFMYS